MADTQALQMAEDTLIDIEVPMPPGIDWLGGLLTLGWVLLALLILLLLGSVVWFVWRRAQLYWRLERLKRTLAKEPSEAVKDGAVLLYQALQTAKRHRLLGGEAEERLKCEIDQACFGPQSVSRETLSALIQTFQANLKAAAPTIGDGFRALFSIIRTGFCRLFARRRKPAQTLRGNHK